MRPKFGRALALAGLLALAAPALADATIDTELTAEVSKGSKFLVQADVTMSNRGVVTLAGTVGGTQYQLTKKFKTKAGRSRTKTIKFKIDPRKLGVVDQTDTVILTAQMSAAEDGQEDAATATGGTSLPPPLMLVPGLGNELDSAQFKLVFLPFLSALNENGGSPWLTKGKRATLRVQKYFSTSFPIEQLGQTIAKQGEKMVKKSKVFAKIDLIGQSTGGLVVRQAMLPAVSAKAPASLAGKVRHVFFFGAPQSGTPLAYVAQQALLLTKDLPNGVREQTLEAIKAQVVGNVDSPSAASLSDLLLRPARKQGQTPPFLGVVELFLPTYPFAEIPTGVNTTAIVDYTTLTGLAGEAMFPVLADLNGASPDPGSVYHAFYYSDVAGATGPVRTADGLDLVAFVAGGGTDLSLVQTVNGPGDGITTETSTLMTAHPQWNSVLIPIDLGPGLHFPNADSPTTPAYYNDTNVIGYVLQRVLAPLPTKL